MGFFLCWDQNPGLMRFDAHWLAARGEGPSSTCRPRPGGPAPGRRGTSRGAQALTAARLLCTLFWCLKVTTLLALKLRKFIFEEISFRVSESLGWPTWALQRRSEARQGRLSQIPRSGELPRPPPRSQGSKEASSRWLSDCHCHRLYLAGSREMIRCAATATCVES